MPITQAMCDYLADLVSGNGGTLFNNAAIGASDSNAAFDVNQTDLQGSNKLRKGMDSGYPAVDPEDDGSDSKIRYQSTFGPDDANWAWKEWGVFNSTTSGSGTMFLREVEDLGTKTSGAT